MANKIFDYLSNINLDLYKIYDLKNRLIKKGLKCLGLLKSVLEFDLKKRLTAQREAAGKRIGAVKTELQRDGSVFFQKLLIIKNQLRRLRGKNLTPIPKILR